MKKTKLLSSTLLFVITLLSSCGNVSNSEITITDAFNLIKGQKYTLEENYKYYLSIGNDENNWSFEARYFVDYVPYFIEREFTLNELTEYDNTFSKRYIDLSVCKLYSLEISPLRFDGHDGRCDNTSFAWFMNSFNKYMAIEIKTQKVYFFNEDDTTICEVWKVESKTKNRNAYFSQD